MLIDGRCLKRSSLRSGCFYGCVNESEQDNDGRTNLALHPDQQVRNSTARVDRVKYFREDLGDVRCIWHPWSMKVYRYIKVIEVWKEFGIGGRFQAFFQQYHLEEFLLKMSESYHRQYSVCWIRKWKWLLAWGRVHKLLQAWKSYWQYFGDIHQNLKKKKKVLRERGSVRKSPRGAWNNRRGSSGDGS